MKHMRKLWASLLVVLLICLPVCAQAEEVISQEDALLAAEAPAEVVEAAEEEDASEPPVISAEPMDAEVPEAEALSLGEADDPSAEDDALTLEEDALSIREGALPIEETDLIEENDAAAPDDALPSAEGSTDWTSSDAMNASANGFTIENGVLTKYNGTDSIVNIPEGVVSIGDSAFQYNSRMTKVTIPDTVTSIGYGAFRGCTKLLDIQLPQGLTAISGEMLRACRSLEEITIPNSVISIGAKAFYECTNLKSIQLPEMLIEIPDEMLRGCTSLKEITLPDNVHSIGTHAFSSCALTTIHWSKDLTQIGDYGFSGCKFTDIILPEGLKYIGKYAFSSIGSLKTVTFSDSISSVGSYAFYGSGSGGVTYYINCISGAYGWARKNVSSSYLVVSGHDFQPMAEVAATCTQDGQTGGIQCVKCGDISEKPTVVKATGHKRVTVKGYPATCTQDGRDNGVSCSVCGEVLIAQSTLSKLGHIVVKDRAVKETYFTPGLTEGSHCLTCGTVFAAQQAIPALGPSPEFHMSANATNNVVVGQQFQIVLDGGLAAKSFKSNKKKVVKVSGSGLVTARKRGSAKITIKLTDGKSLTLKVKVGRNKVSGIYSKPTLSYIDYGQNIYLNSVEIVSPGKVVVQYWLLFKRLPSITTTKFSYITDTIYGQNSQVAIVNGTVRNVRVKTRGMHVKSFKVTYRGGAVSNTNVNLALLQATEGILDNNDFFLNWLY